MPHGTAAMKLLVGSCPNPTRGDITRTIPVCVMLEAREHRLHPSAIPKWRADRTHFFGIEKNFFSC